MPPQMSMKARFALQRASSFLTKMRDLTTLLTLAGTRPGPLAWVGTAAHALGLGVGLVTDDYSQVAARWRPIDVPPELRAISQAALAGVVVRRDEGWTYCEVPGSDGPIDVLFSDEGVFAQRSPEEVTTWIREQAWARAGIRASLVPTDRWACAQLRASEQEEAWPSRRADEVWSSYLEVFFRAGIPRGLLLNGPPRTGKSTIARRLVARLEELLGRPVRELEIEPAAFGDLRPSTIQAAVRLLRPDVVRLDDLDRYPQTAELLRFFELLKRCTLFVVVTTNCKENLPLALRMHGRIDRVVEVAGIGEEGAAVVAPTAWAALSPASRKLVEGWPLGLAQALEEQVTLFPGASADAEAAGIERQRQEVEAPRPAPKPKKKPPSAAPATARRRGAEAPSPTPD